MAATDLERNTLLENLDECVQDKNEIVTFDWFSESFGVHVNESKNLLQEYASKNKSGFQTLCLGGTDDNGGLTICVTTEDRLTDLASRLKKKLFQHIYSIQKSRLSDLHLLYTVDHGKFKENADASGKFSTIRSNSETPKINGVKEEAKPVSNGTATAKTSKAAVAQAFTKIVKPVAVEGKVDMKQEPVNETKPAAPKRGRSAGKISSMFARQQSRPRVEKSKDVEEKEPEKPAVEARAETKAPEVTKKEEAKTKNKRVLEEKEDSKKKKQKPQQKKMRRIQHIFDSSDSESSDNFERAPSPAEEQGPPAAETLESDDEPEPETQQAVSTAAGTRKRTMKLVTKQFMDEDGFLITKKEYEACSESDEEEKTAAAPPTAAAAAAQKAPVSGQSTAISKEPVKRPSSPPAKKKQSTISSFFTRK